MKTLIAIIIGLLWLFTPTTVHAQQFVWPVSCPITSYFGGAHLGIDLGCGWGTPIVAVESGTVTFAGWDTTGFGNRVDIDNGTNNWRYAHLETIAVWYGQAVSQGQYIGSVGSTGNSTGPHLHLEVWWQGQAVDPLIPLP